MVALEMPCRNRALHIYSTWHILVPSAAAVRTGSAALCATVNWYWSR